MSIHILSSDLSSQISAGEVIEKPASVVKEIIENSIDAQSKSIRIAIEKSGFQYIMLNDDGIGIDQKDLPLAIARHATSKINSLSDLDSITTFGFRGEALASIRAVSRLTLISCTSSNEIAWKIYSEGFINDIIFTPTAHPIGTTIIIENLFYNMPVRLKFLKNQRLEFLRILMVINKIALSHFNINFSLTHNKKLIMEFNSIKNNKNRIHRLKDIFNNININKLLEINGKKNNIFLFGWISFNDHNNQYKNIQYCYINNRCINNNIFLNAVRSACTRSIGRNDIFFILYLNIPSYNIDINIHPTKNEIKFHHPDIIRTFIHETIFQHLQNFQKKYFFKNIVHNYQNSLEKKDNFFNIKCNQSYCSIGKLLIVTRKYYGLIYRRDNFLLISFPLAQGMVRKRILENQIKQNIIPKCFFSNIKINLNSKKYLILSKNKRTLLKFGFNLIFKKKYVILRSIPVFFKKQNIDILILDFFNFFFSQKELPIFEAVNWFYKNIFIELKNWNYLDGVNMLLEIEYYYPYLLKNPPQKLLQKVNINKALCILKI